MFESFSPGLASVVLKREPDGSIRSREDVCYDPAMSKEAIDAFWAWWPTIKDKLDASISSREGFDDEIIEQMNAHVAAIGSDLDWELGKGLESEHHLCLSAKGDPVGRLLTERWLARGPGRDATWEYHAARQAAPPGMSLEIAGHAIELEDFVFTIEEDESREVLDIVGYHPSYPNIEDEDLRARMMFIALDQALGEDGVERWIGSVGVSQEEVEDGVSLQELRDAVAELVESATHDRWAVLRGGSDEQPVFVSANLAAKRIDNLERDVHLVVGFPLANPTDKGLTTDEEANALNDIEDDLTDRFGEHALYLGRRTTAGRRELHFRVQEGGPAGTVVDAWAKQHPSYVFETEMKLDPRWELHAW